MAATGMRKACMHQILQMVFEGKWKPGQDLPPERELSAMLGTSRSTVNQAILELARMGFLKVRPRKGVEVADFLHHPTKDTLSYIVEFDAGLLDSSLFQDFMDLRILIERECVQLALSQFVKGNSLQHLKEMKRICKVWEDNLEALDEDSLYDFHSALVEAGNNQAYRLLFLSFESMLRQLMHQHLSKNANLPNMVKLHAKLLDALDRKNPNQADASILMLLQDAKEHLIQSFSSKNTSSR